jgi:apolipoprotein N-acyltransferase
MPAVAGPTIAVGANGNPAVATAERSWRVPRLILAVVSGLLLAAAFPDLDLEPLAWIGFVPLLLAVRRERPRTAFALGWTTGFVFYVATVYWVAYTITRYTAVPMAVAVPILFLMAAVLACYHGAFVAVLRWLEQRGLPAFWLAPPLWVTLEWLRSWFFIGFPWAALGYSQHRFHDLVQMVEVTGVYGVSALLVFFNVVAAEALVVRRSRRELLAALSVLTVLVLFVPLAGRWRVASLAERPPAGRLRVAIAQGNIEQDHKWDPAYQGETLARYRELTAAAAASHPDLVVWPETATPFFFQQSGPLREEVLAIAEQSRVHLLFGSPAFRQDRQGVIRELNRAYLVTPEGREVATYDKIQLVPFGEYVPFKSILFFVSQIAPAVGEMEAGLSPTVFPTASGRFGVLVCYEGIFPALTRRFVAAGADFLVNITNDAWYGPTSAPAQHLVQASLRAVENRVPLVRAANTGISAFIGPDGRVRWRSPLFEPAWHVEEITWPGVRTFYSRYGDVFAWTCALVSFGVIVAGALRRRR